MPLSYNEFTSVGTTACNLSWSFLLRAHVKVYKNRDLLADTGTLLSETTHYTWTGASQITLATAIASGEVVTIERQTPNTSQLSPWTDGSNLTAEALNNADLQNLYVVQEQQDKNDLGATKSIAASTASTNAVNTANAALPKAGGSMSGVIAMGTNKITGLGDPTAAQDAVTKAYLERTGSITTTQISDGTLVDGDISNTAEINVSKLKDGNARQLIQTNSGGTGVEWTDNVDIPGTLDVTGAVDLDSTLNVDGAATFASITASGTITGSLTGTATDLAAAAKVTDTEQATHTVSNTSYFTTKASDARYFNISSGDTIKDGQTFPDNDTTIATTAAINDRIIDLVDDVGGFVPIANETSFPTANPDVNNPPGAGTLVSIKEFASSHTPSGGTVTIANGAGSGNTVTITGCGSTVLAAGFGGIVETTSTLHTYTFHRLSPKATEVTTVAGNITNVNTVAGAISNVNTVATNATNITTVAVNISNVNAVGGSISSVNAVASNLSDVNNFSNLYQISSSAPTTDGGNNALAAGDLWFDSSSNKTLKVHNGTSFQAVSPTQQVLNDISIVSGQITFSEDLGSIADALSTGTGNNINTVATNIANVNSVGGSISNVNTVAGISSNVTSVAGAISNINTTVSNLSSINNFAEVYRIASSAPSSSLNEGDLWYDSANNLLKYYNGTIWTVTAAAGLSNIIEDTSPELGGHLDCNDKNLSEVGTISGNNLQVDFGTLS